jgi:hypothetical protein
MLCVIGLGPDYNVTHILQDGADKTPGVYSGEPLNSEDACAAYWRSLGWTRRLDWSCPAPPDPGEAFHYYQDSGDGQYKNVVQDGNEGCVPNTNPGSEQYPMLPNPNHPLIQTLYQAQGVHMAHGRQPIAQLERVHPALWGSCAPFTPRLTPEEVREDPAMGTIWSCDYGLFSRGMPHHCRLGAFEEGSSVSGGSLSVDVGSKLAYFYCDYNETQYGEASPVFFSANVTSTQLMGNLTANLTASIGLDANTINDQLVQLEAALQDYLEFIDTSPPGTVRELVQYCGDIGWW